MILNHLKERRVGQIIYRIVPPDGRVEVLLVRCDDLGYRDGYSIPKGKLEDGETEEEGSAREVQEETGLITEIVANLGTRPYQQTTITVFLSRYQSGGLDTSGRALDGDGENTEVRFYPIEFALTNINPKYKWFLLQAQQKIRSIENGKSSS